MKINLLIYLLIFVAVMLVLQSITSKVYANASAGLSDSITNATAVLHCIPKKGRKFHQAIIAI